MLEACWLELGTGCWFGCAEDPIPDKVGVQVRLAKEAGLQMDCVS